MGLVLQMLLTSAAPGQPQIHQHWELDGSSKAGKSSYEGGLPIELSMPGSKIRGRFYGRCGSHAITLALPNQSYGFLAVPVIPKTKEGGGVVQREQG